VNGSTLAVDVGTSVIKAAVVSPTGAHGEVTERPAALHRQRDGIVEQDIDEVRRTVLEVVQATAARSLTPITALAVTGQGDGLWLRDAAGAPVRRAISWMDSRATGIVDEWREGIGEDVYRATGSSIFPGSPAALLAWLDRHEPATLDRAAIAGRCVDAVAEHLTGVALPDAADVSAPFLDVAKRRYHEWAIGRCGLEGRRDLLAEPAAPGAHAPLRSDIAQALGLPADIPVHSGPYDVVASHYGAGAHLDGNGVVVLGTTLSCQRLTAPPVAPVDGEPAGGYLATPTTGRALRIMPSMVGTPAIDWLHRILGTAREDLDGMLEASTAGAHGVTALPFLSPAGERAPFVAGHVRARFDGLELATDRQDLMRALCESIAFAARSCLDRLGDVRAVTGVGGGFRSRRLAQLFADVLGVPLLLPRTDQVGIRGAAVLAGTVADRLPDAVLLEPDARTADHYDAAFARYLDTVAEVRR